VGVVRYIGMDVHREFAQLAVVEDGLVRDEGRITVTPEALRTWAADLRIDDQVALEATGNSDAIANLLTPIVGRVVVSGYDLTCRLMYDLTCRSRQGDHVMGSPPATRVRRSLRR
jgi:hypothetical protein